VLLAFITPAHRRFELTELCLRQRRRLIDDLATAGVEATCVVVCDDANAGVAEHFGFRVVRMGNHFLGAKFAAGYKCALDLGATHLMPIGTDSWMMPELLLATGFPDDECVGTRFLSTIRPDGQQRLDMRIEYPPGFGVATLYPRAAMLGEEYPCSPKIHRGCDTSTWNRTARKRRLPIRFIEHGQLEYMDFKSYEVQTTSYKALVMRWAPTVVDGPQAIGDLRECYDDDLVDDLELLYAGRPAWS
jgi:hypothetical protein